MAHQHEMQRLLSDHAIQHSVSRVAELQAKVDSQELMIRHLRHQVAEGEVDQEHLSTLKIKGTTMESRIKELTDELEEAKKSHAPVCNLLYFNNIVIPFRNVYLFILSREVKPKTCL